MKSIWVLFFLLLVSCGKEALLDEAPSMVGTWKHQSEVDAWEIIYIEEDGQGKVEWYTNNKLHQDTKVKGWFVKDNQLYLGKVTFSFSPYNIDTYPITSSSTVIEGYDTLTQGKKYCILNDLYFVEKE